MKTIITNVSNGKRYVLRHFLDVDKYYLIPYNSGNYFDHQFVPRGESWIMINNKFDFSEFDVTKEWFDSYVVNGMCTYNEITENCND